MNAYEELKRRGYNTKHKGTWYLVRAVEMTRDAGRPLMMTKEVYPALAKQMDVSWEQIERSMRYSIGQTEPGRSNSEVVRDVALGMVGRAD